MKQRTLSELIRGLPLRRAPAALESRICRELERRAAQRWWFRGFAQWPASARAFFVVVSGAIIGVTAGDGVWRLIAQVLSETPAPPWTHTMSAVIGSVCGVSALLMRTVPTAWLDGVLISGAALYMALFGLSAAAYRAFYWEPSPAGDTR